MEIPASIMKEEGNGNSWLLERYHPDGLRCPRCQAGTSQARIFRRTKRSQLVVYRCLDCGQTYNLYSGTPFAGKHLRPEQLLSLLQGLGEGKSNGTLADELGINRTTVYYLRKELVGSGVFTDAKNGRSVQGKDGSRSNMPGFAGDREVQSAASNSVPPARSEES